MIDIIAIVLLCVTLGSFGQIYMKKGLMNLGGLNLNDIFSTKFFNIFSEINLVSGILLYGIASVLWLVVLSKAEVSLVYPLISLGYVVTALLAKIYFNEHITFVRWFGIMLIIGGAFLVTRTA